MLIPLKNSQKGFTLVELLVVVFLVATLATIAISSYVNSTDTFSFLSEYKNVISAVRTARSYAITNKETSNQVPERYGIEIRTNRATAFADTGANDFRFDSGGTAASNDAVIKRYNLTDYRMQVLDSSAAHNLITPIPITIFYETGTGELTIFDGATPRNIIDKNDQKYIAICFYEKVVSGSTCKNTTGLKKYIIMFQVSGLPEEFNNLNEL